MYYKQGARPKSLEFYNLECKRFVDYDTNFEWILDNLAAKNQMTDFEANKHIFVKEKSID